MAAKTPADDSSGCKNAVVYVMPQRIQKKMLQDIKNGVKKTDLKLREHFGPDVTHIVTQYTDQDQVLQQLQRDGADIGDDEELDDINVVSLSWLSACLKAGTAVPVEDKHLVKRTKKSPKKTEGGSKKAADKGEGRAPQQAAVPPWACQRVTPLKHHNHKFTDALEILEKHAQLRSGPSDELRALAFRRASCVLKSLPFPVESVDQVKGLKDIGGHALKVIKSILEDGHCEEVQEIISSEWFKLMEEFTSVYGIGPATAKKWIANGWKSIDDVRKNGPVSKDERVIWALAFHEDLTSPVSKEEAEAFVSIVKAEAERIRPGVITTLCGGFRRGKSNGHDVDILFTHPTEGQEKGLLPALLEALEKRDLVLMGKHEASTYTPKCLQAGSRSDHFEKWLGMIKFPKKTPAGEQKPGSSGESSGGAETSGAKAGEGSEASRDGAEGKKKPTAQGGEKKLRQMKLGELGKSKQKKQGDEEEEDEDLEPKAKKQKTTTTTTTTSSASTTNPEELAKGERDWRARRVDLIVSPYSQYFYALVGWTGNKQFNRDLRTYCNKELNMKLTSHGLWDNAKKKSLPAASEEEVFKNLKLEYKEPAHRNC